MRTDGKRAILSLQGGNKGVESEGKKPRCPRGAMSIWKRLSRECPTRKGKGLLGCGGGESGQPEGPKRVTDKI